MSLPTITHLSLEELQKHRGEVDAQIEAKQIEIAAAIREKLTREAKAAGLTLDQVLKTTRKKRARPIYKNPDNPKQTWSGKANQPQWVKDQLARGKQLAELQI